MAPGASPRTSGRGALAPVLGTPPSPAAPSRRADVPPLVTVPGHRSVAVDTDDGLVILAGQACYTADEWDGDPDALEGRSSAPDQPAYDRSIERLRGLQPTRVLFGHDRDPWVA
jgi:hypothetical protein